MNSDENNQISRWDFTRVFLRSSLEQGSWNYERMHNLGFEYILVPVIERLYPNKADRIAAMSRHLAFFNTTPVMQSLITGVTMNMETEVAAGRLPAEHVNQVKTALMGPLASFGDPLLWAVLRPMIAAIAIELSLSNSPVWGPIFFFVAWNGLRLTFRYISQSVGYKRGLNILEIVQSSLIKNVVKASSVFGMFLMGALIARFVSLNAVRGLSSVSIINHLNFSPVSILSAVVAICLMSISMWLLRHRVNAVWIMLGITAICVMLAMIKVI